MGNEETDLSPGLQKFLNAIAYFIAFFFWLNLYGFLNLFFGILVPNHPKNDFLHYTILAIILIIAACVTETLRRRRNLRLFLSYTALLFIVNAVVIWRNWYFH